MDLIEVVVAEDNPVFAEMFKMEIAKTKDMHLAGHARDGEEAVRLVKEKQPDLLILDNILPLLDGVGVLKALNEAELEKRPVIIAISSFLSELFLEEANLYGADYCMSRDMSYAVILDRGRSFVKSTGSYHIEDSGSILPKRAEGEEPDYYYAITALLHNLGFPANLKGYEYLRRAVMIAIEDTSALSGVTKVIYPKIASEYNSSPSNVERDIRNAIETSYTRADSRIFLKLFKPIVDKRKGRPTNSEVIATLTQYIISYA